MSLSNIRDSLVKNPLVSDAHARVTEGHRPGEAAAVHTLRELAREAEERVAHINPSSEDAHVREDGHGGRDAEERERKDRPSRPPEEETAAGEGSTVVGSRRLDVIA